MLETKSTGRRRPQNVMRPAQSTLKLKLKRFIFKPLFALDSALRLLRSDQVPKPIDTSSLRRVLIVQFGGIGDALRVFPIIELLARDYPDLELFTLTDQPTQFFALLPHPGTECTHLPFDFNLNYLRKLVAAVRLRQHRFDLILMPSRGDGVVETSLIGVLAGGRYRVGFDIAGAIGYTHRLEFCPRSSILQQNLDLLRLLGLRVDVAKLQIAIPRWASDKALQLRRELRCQNDYVIAIHPWVAFEAEFRAWRPARYRALVGRLRLAYPQAHVLLLGGPLDRERTFSVFDSLRDEKVHNLAGFIDLPTTAALLSLSQLFICNDSSLLHLADALRVPSLVLFGSTDPIQVLSPESQCQVIQAPSNLACRPCYQHQPDFDWRCDNSFACMEGISVDSVLKLATTVMAQPDAA